MNSIEILKVCGYQLSPFGTSNTEWIISVLFCEVVKTSGIIYYATQSTTDGKIYHLGYAEGYNTTGDVVIQIGKNYIHNW